MDRFSVSFGTLPMSGGWRGKVAAPKRFFRVALIYISLRCIVCFLSPIFYYLVSPAQLSFNNQYIHCLFVANFISVPQGF